MTDSAKLYLGVDGGQSSTTAVIGDEHGRVLGVGKGGPCNHVSTAEAKARFSEAIGGALLSARETAGVSDAAFDAACLGLSGGPADKDALSREIVRAKKYRITHDADIALSGATAGEPGIIVIAGTGSIAYGRNAGGETARAGGWGYIFGDEGGAFDIVRQALRAVLRYEEGWGQATALRDALLDAAGETSANSLLHRFYTPEFPRQKIAAFAKVVDETAQQGDRVAMELLNSAAQTLTSLATTVRHRLFEESEIVTVAYIGGVFQSRSVRERFRILVELSDGCTVQAPRYGPAHGALIEAYRLAGLPAEPTGTEEHL
ncbi:MAG: BadF/BadG/BcrA/BcrD ATPase family protein [Bryobacteraceae bacterium]